MRFASFHLTLGARCNRRKEFCHAKDFYVFLETTPRIANFCTFRTYLLYLPVRTGVSNGLGKMFEVSAFFQTMPLKSSILQAFSAKGEPMYPWRMGVSKSDIVFLGLLLV